MLAGLSLAVVLFIIYQLFSFTIGTRSVRRMKERDLRELKRLIAQFMEALIPFSQEEFRILSARVSFKESRRSGGIFMSGILSSIYQEALIAFAAVERDNRPGILMMANTDSDNFKFESTDDKTEIWCNDDKLGEIDSEGFFRDNEGQLLVRLAEDSTREFYTMYLREKEVAHLRVYSWDKVNESDRVFSFFHEFSASYDKSFIAYILYYMLVRKEASV
jgi:hypothetical protein